MPPPSGRTLSILIVRTLLGMKYLQFFNPAKNVSQAFQFRVFVCEKVDVTVFNDFSLCFYFLLSHYSLCVAAGRKVLSHYNLCVSGVKKNFDGYRLKLKNIAGLTVYHCLDCQ